MLQWMMREWDHDQQTSSGVVVFRSKVTALRAVIEKGLAEQPEILAKAIDRIINHITNEENVIPVD